MGVVRVGFTLIGGHRWTGGRNYLLNLLGAISSYQQKHIAPVVFTGTESGADELAEVRKIPGLELVVSPIWDAARKSRQTLNALLLGRDRAIVRQLREYAIDVFFEAACYIGWRSGIATIGWIPDLQHRVMPELFTWRLWLRREIGIQVQVRSKRIVMLSSGSARNDFSRFYNTALDRTRVVRFAVPSALDVERSAARAVAKSYQLPERYFFLPNQFWCHKNHVLVLEAARILKSRGRPVVIAATGAGQDPRAPRHFEEIMQRIRSEKLKQQFRYLGLVPYEHLAPLMIASEALLNPSLFEGWSTTVEEARSLGVPMLLSDLAVHREQAGNSAVYFNPRNAESLATVLEQFVATPEAERQRLSIAAGQDAAERRKRFAAEFVALCEEAVAVRERAGQDVGGVQ